MKLRNFWLNKSKEKNILKVVEWAHRQGIMIEILNTDNIIEAIKVHLRETSHS